MVASHRGGNHRSAHPTSPPKGSLTRDKHIRDILILAKEGQVQDDLQGLGIRCHHDKLADPTVKGFGGLVGALAELLVVAGLLDQVQDGVRQGGVSKGGSLLVSLKSGWCVSHYHQCIQEDTHGWRGDSPVPLVHHSKNREGRTMFLVSYENSFDPRSQGVD